MAAASLDGSCDAETVGMLDAAVDSTKTTHNTYDIPTHFQTTTDNNDFKCMKLMYKVLHINFVRACTDYKIK